ncbi:hypothetical protein [Actinomadura sp. NPDC049753]|uniref:hypothetical protein n=1 Tax=Actinomadura sp. NPDC049753 TaxID=3154739 RepID=UPI003448817C
MQRTCSARVAPQDNGGAKPLTTHADPAETIFTDAGSPLAMVRERLRHVRWIGGGSGGGKTTTARLLAEQGEVYLYDTDATMPVHARRMPVEQAPYLGGFAAMSMDERWVTRTPEAMLDTFHWYQGEGFYEIIKDLLELPDDRPVIAEGFRLLPGLVRPLLTREDQAVWLLPTPEFRKSVFEHRGGLEWGFVAKTSDPEQALENLLQRDAMFTDRIADQIRHLGLHGFKVDFSVAKETLAQQVSALFGLN